MQYKKVCNCLVGIFILMNARGQSVYKDLTKYVNPLIGTGAVDKNSLSGSNFPGPTLPFSMVQLSPDTEDAPDDPASGYDYYAKTIVGFSHTHLSGTGVSDLFDILLIPTNGRLYMSPGTVDKKKPGFRSTFSHQDEQAIPGYYQVKLTDYGINAELTSSAHVGMHRYTFSEKDSSRIIIDLDHSLNKKRTYWSCKILDAQIKVIAPNAIEGYRIITGWANMRKVYFHIEFSKPFKDVLFANGNGAPKLNTILNGNALKAAAEFDTKPGEQILSKVALSAVSIENARENMQAEIPNWDFDQVKQNAHDIWEKELDKIAIDGTDSQKTIFYTALYHAFTQPNNIADVNGDYMATDYTIHKAEDKTHYSTFSIWDTYRAANPLYSLIAPKKSGAFINSMLRQYQTYGFLPIWQLWGEENYCMIGNHSIPVIVDAVMKGIGGFNVDSAYEAVKNSSLRDHQGSPFSVWEKYHYIPENIQSQSVSIALEMSFDDWCVAQFAKHLGKTADYNYFMQRAQYYKNLHNKQTNFFQAKNSDGQWLPKFNPLDYGGNGGSPFTEGNAWQYYWYVPQDVPSLIDITGGKEAFTQKLDTFFTLVDKSGETNGNASGFIGQYAHGNEPSHHVTYLYDYAGQPWKTQYYVSKVLREQYTTASSGYSGNDDCGQMSAWYIFSSMGFYPVNPASGVYAIGSPILKSATITLPNGKIFTIKTKNVSDQNFYIEKIKLNGKDYPYSYITQTVLDQGGTMEFEMGNKPNKKRAINTNAYPLEWGYNTK
ncbi:GH92 family glycosyl hydrolase [Rhizosphaericola mali]|uniref:Glycoside hydrolase family 92 protein n=1 Tax=Rhizosphaericola mali TaxID=2545455 RepID=A0A5P2FUL0_9BACT|nr:GH92 family glycosyl hydrolase [Rhizosphaericola mali]QES87144.1 glycoside hydrolase family 92 protein [Rhizosphaericola mali]